VRTCAKLEVGVDLVLALKRPKEHLPLLATNIPAIMLLQSLFRLLKVQTVKLKF